MAVGGSDGRTGYGVCRVRRATGAVLLLVGLTGGCAGLSARGADAAAAAEAFESAVRGGDHAAACFLLAPQTRSELMESRGAGCAAALGEARLPAPGARRGVQVYGRQAMVTFEADTLFLSQFPGSWRVVAAGCVPEPGEPYNCRVKGV
ncbi:hypothetical protein [Streptomyces cadmiisoli]|uniref:hypothetical protein n=1 Tax=Streptomyces cadmiisoli TaxID=2184053 RepID=UPI00365BB000